MGFVKVAEDGWVKANMNDYRSSTLRVSLTPSTFSTSLASSISGLGNQTTLIMHFRS